MIMLGGTFAGRLCGVLRNALLALAVLAAPPAHAKDSGRIVAVGDLHGDFAAWQDVARDARLMDANGHWIGGPTTLVQLGDITDRWPDSLKIIRSLQQLAKEAPHTKGRVIVRGKTVRRGDAKKADYLLYYQRDLPPAGVEANEVGPP